MIIGMGCDLCKIDRAKKVFSSPRRLMRCFTPREIEYVEGSETSLAGHFAAKEAVAKAFGTGFRAFGLKDVEILHDNLGRPYLAFDALTRIQKAVNLQGTLRVHLSISHEREYAMATCIIEKTSY